MRLTRALALCGLLLPLAAPTAAFAKATEQKSLGEIVPDKALLYAIRPIGAQNKKEVQIYSDTTFLLHLRGNSYGFALLEPGRYKIWGWGMAGLNEIEFVPGEAFFLLVTALDFALVKEEEGQAWLSAVKYYMPPDPEVEAKHAKKKERTPKDLRRREKFRIDVLDEPRIEVARPSAPKMPDDRADLIRVPAYSAIQLELMETVSSYLNTLGEEVWFRTREDASVDERVWLPTGTPVKGTIVEIHGVGRVGRAGGFEIAIASLVTSDGIEIPLIGQVIDTGRDKSRKAFGGGGVGGIFRAALVKGREAFEVCGEDWKIWTRYEAWVAPVGTVPPGKPVRELQRPQTFDIRPEGTLSFNLETHQEPPEVALILDTAEPIASLKLHSVADWEVPEPPAAQRIERQSSTSIAIFEGWSLLRHLRSEDEPTRVRFAGRTEAGEPFEAVGSLTWQENSPE